MTETTDPQPDRIPIGQSVAYVVRGMPEVADEYSAERTIAPTEIILSYRSAPDSQLGRVSAYVKGWWMEGGARVPMDKPVGRWFYNGPDGWPEWLAEEARLHDPDAAVPCAPADRAACTDPIECGHEAAIGQAQQEVRLLGLMVDEYGAGASALTAKLKRVRDLHRETCIAARGEVPPTAFKCGMCEVLDAPATELRRMAGEAQQPADTCRPFEVDGEVVSVRGSGDFTEQEREFAAEIIRAAKRKYAAEHPDADEAQQPETQAEVVHGCPPDGSGLTPCCGRTPFELPPTDRMAADPALVTCQPTA